jgi:hypothetical protein
VFIIGFSNHVSCTESYLCTMDAAFGPRRAVQQREDGTLLPRCGDRATAPEWQRTRHALIARIDAGLVTPTVVQ